MAGLKRTAGGGGLFLTRYEATGGQGMVSFASKVPGRIFPIDVAPGHGYVVHRHGWVCGTAGITPSVALQQTFRGGLWGGEGFILQKLEGEGQAWIELSGEITTYELAAGQSLLVHPGHVGMFNDSVTLPGDPVAGHREPRSRRGRAPPRLAHRTGQHLAAVHAALGAGPCVVGVPRGQRQPPGCRGGTRRGARRGDRQEPLIGKNLERPRRLSRPQPPLRRVALGRSSARSARPGLSARSRGTPAVDDDPDQLPGPDQSGALRHRQGEHQPATLDLVERGLGPDLPPRSRPAPDGRIAGASRPGAVLGEVSLDRQATRLLAQRDQPRRGEHRHRSRSQRSAVSASVDRQLDAGGETGPRRHAGTIRDGSENPANGCPAREEASCDRDPRARTGAGRGAAAGR